MQLSIIESSEVNLAGILKVFTEGTSGPLVDVVRSGSPGVSSYLGIKYLRPMR
jgi:hypothetical protein